MFKLTLILELFDQSTDKKVQVAKCSGIDNDIKKAVQLATNSMYDHIREHCNGLKDYTIMYMIRNNTRKYLTYQKGRYGVIGKIY